MALIPAPQLPLIPRDQVHARRLRRFAGAAGLLCGAAATTIGVQSLILTGSHVIDWTIAGVGVTLMAYGVGRLRPRDVPPEAMIQPARVHLLSGACCLLLGAAVPALGMSLWAAAMFGGFGLVELGKALRVYQRSRRPPQ